MAKRVRGSSTRPGQRAPLQRRPTTATAPAAAAAPRPATLTAEEERRAAELEAQIVAEERSAEDARKRGTARATRPVTDESGIRPASSLAVRAAEEYAYVGRDVKRITLIGGSLILIMIVLWIVAHAMGAGPI
jgi:hypothetical protein